MCLNNKIETNCYVDDNYINLEKFTCTRSAFIK